jgi:rhamnose utilization protein RhaD (predicted bifunctional aldolase and dehydrogenase)
VQGAGGNVSWKDGSILWVKASGMWLAEANSKNIFVPVNLMHLQSALSKQDFYVKPEMASSSELRPSIETLLHALMPHRVVVHLHAVEILAHLVRANIKQEIHDLVGDVVKWIFVDYFKPGADLARAVYEQLRNKPDADVVFMGNHGVVIGGENIDEVTTALHRLTSSLKAKTPCSALGNSATSGRSDLSARGYIPCVDREVSLLATEEKFLTILRHDWALYPDHVVFLGPQAVILESGFSLLELDEAALKTPTYIVAAGDGVYESLSATPAQKAQIRCYFDVLARQDGLQKLRSLNQPQIADLLDWDAEKYRTGLDS